MATNGDNVTPQPHDIVRQQRLLSPSLSISRRFRRPQTPSIDDSQPLLNRLLKMLLIIRVKRRRSGEEGDSINRCLCYLTISWHERCCWLNVFHDGLMDRLHNFKPQHQPLLTSQLLAALLLWHPITLDYQLKQQYPVSIEMYRNTDTLML